MSGGTFNYSQERILYIIDEIEERLEKQGKEIPKGEWYPAEQTHYETYPEEVQKIMRDAVMALKRAYVYARRIDWYIAGDDSEESLYRRLDEDLKKLQL